MIEAYWQEFLVVLSPVITLLVYSAVAFIKKKLPEIIINLFSKKATSVIGAEKFEELKPIVVQFIKNNGVETLETGFKTLLTISDKLDAVIKGNLEDGFYDHNPEYKAYLESLIK